METPMTPGDEKLSELIENVLLEIGLTPDYRGYRYLVCAIAMVAENEELIYNVTTCIYPAIAQRFHTNPANIERSIRTAIGVLWSQTEAKVLEKALGRAYSLPLGNAKFIAVLSRRLMMKHPQAGCKKS